VTVLAVHPAAALFPLLDGTELDALASDIKTNGLRNPIALDASGALLDGRNRLAACERAGVPPTFVTVDAEPVGYVISQNIHRRHLTTGQRSVLALEVEKLLAVEPKDKGGRPRRDEKPRANLPAVSDEKRTRKRAADAVNVSRKSVDKAKKLADAAPDLFAEVAAGKSTLERASEVMRRRDAEQRRHEKVKAEAAAQLQSWTVDLRLGDFRNVLADISGVDAVITDPPYPFEFLQLLPDLAAWADKVLKPDGVLVVLMGQTYLPDVYRLLDGGRAYRWTGAYLTPGPSFVSHTRRCVTNWKPLLVYGGGPRFHDMFNAAGDDKTHHKWGQDYNAFTEIVRRFTEPGQLVADPFAGAGTTLLAANHIGRHSIGAEVDPDAHAVALRRLA